MINAIKMLMLLECMCACLRDYELGMVDLKIAMDLTLR